MPGTPIEFFAGEDAVRRSLHVLHVLRELGLGYLRLGQPATELSVGEAQRIKLATELQRTQRGQSLNPPPAYTRPTWSGWWRSCTGWWMPATPSIVV